MTGPVELHPTLFVRIPQVQEGHLVTLENIETVRAWCEGVIFGEDTPKPYIRIPTNNPGQIRSRYEAQLNQWIVKIGANRGYSVYSQPYIEKNFLLVPNETDIGGSVKLITRLLGAEPVVAPHQCCAHHHHSNFPVVPNAPKPANFQPRRAS